MLNDVLAFATINHRLHRGRRFGVKPDDLLRHLWTIGKTGMGKSTLLETLFVAQMEAGHGAGLLDPHGDLAERVLDRVPRARRRDLVLLDPARAGPTPSLNLVGYHAIDARPLAAAAALSVLRKMFDAGWGPRTEHVLRNSILALLDVPRSTIAGVLRLIDDDRFRAMAMRHVRDPVVRSFWEREFVSLDCASMCPLARSATNGEGAFFERGSMPAHCLILETDRHGLVVVDTGSPRIAAVPVPGFAANSSRTSCRAAYAGSVARR